MRRSGSSLWSWSRAAGVSNVDRRMERVGVLAMSWLEGCVEPGWCEGSDVNGDGVVDFVDFVLVEGCFIDN